MKSVNMTSGKVNISLLKFALPILIGNIFQQFYNIADTTIAGHLLGDNALSAIGATNSINSLVLTFAFGVNGGMGILLSQSFGENNKEKIKKVFAGMITFNVAISVIIAVFALIFLKPILTLMNTPTSDFESAYSYIIVLLIFSVATMIYNMEATALRSLGVSITPLLFLIFSTVLNVILDYFFIAKLNMGVSGAAKATVTSQFIAAVLCGIVIMKKAPSLKIKLSDFKCSKNLFKSLITSGLTMGLMNSLFSIGSVIMQSSINEIGSSYIAAHLASRKIAEVFMQPLVTIGSTAQTFVGQNYGAGKPNRIRDSVKWCTLYSAVWSVISFCVLFFLGGTLTVLMTGSKNPDVIAATSMYLKVNAPFFFALGLLFNIRFSIQSLNSRVPPLISSGIELVMKLIAAFFLIPKFGFVGAAVAEPISWCLGVLYLIIPFLSRLKGLDKLFPASKKGNI